MGDSVAKEELGRSEAFVTPMRGYCMEQKENWTMSQGGSASVPYNRVWSQRGREIGDIREAGRDRFCSTYEAMAEHFPRPPPRQV